jgi:hypothetical protein
MCQMFKDKTFQNHITSIKIARTIATQYTLSVITRVLKAIYYVTKYRILLFKVFLHFELDEKIPG